MVAEAYSTTAAERKSQALLFIARPVIFPSTQNRVKVPRLGAPGLDFETWDPSPQRIQ